MPLKIFKAYEKSPKSIFNRLVGFFILKIPQIGLGADFLVRTHFTRSDVYVTATIYSRPRLNQDLPLCGNTETLH